eukprot:TRINITY_DN6267_c0_g1_i2.p1 TRINITY_DN6267_c0_g1~~TRINITY_DN6267_c0_g1_i2.p1  ORF type:complete len:108 (-),score=8.22 TRINITY_DN6267_c0_g1_i2:1561-1884(-)
MIQKILPVEYVSLFKMTMEQLIHKDFHINGSFWTSVGISSNTLPIKRFPFARYKIAEEKGKVASRSIFRKRTKMLVTEENKEHNVNVSSPSRERRKAPALTEGSNLI